MDGNAVSVCDSMWQCRGSGGILQKNVSEIAFCAFSQAKMQDAAGLLSLCPLQTFVVVLLQCSCLDICS